MDKWFEKLDGRWRKLPVRKQHRYTLIFFLGYAILTAGVTLKVWYGGGKSNQGLVIEHIENPLVQEKAVSKGLVDSTRKRSDRDEPSIGNIAR